MTESILPKKVRFVRALAISATTVLTTSCVLCESASAQGLLNRIRTRVEARMRLPPPPPVSPANPYGYRPPVAGPYANPALSPRRPRVLSTPVPQQYVPAAGLADRRADAIAAAEANSNRTGSELRYAAKPPLENLPADYSSGDDSSVMRSPMEATGYRVTQSESPRGPDLPAGLKPVRPRASLGISARDASPQRGVIVVDVNDGSAGKVAGIEVNDRIVAAAGRLIRDTGGLIREFSLSKPGDSVTLGIVRGDAMRDVVVEMGGPDGTLARVAPDASNAMAPSAKTTDSPPAEGTSSSGNSLFSGVGSALGNFFGGAPTPQMDVVESAEAATGEPAKQVYELPAPAAEPDSPSSDPLALPEDK